jgi:serine/threonine protein kinase
MGHTYSTDKIFYVRETIHTSLEVKVELGNFNGSNTLVIKKSIINLPTTDEKTVNEFISEYTNLTALKHHNIIKILGGSYDKISPYIIQEYAPYGSLNKFVKSKLIEDISIELCRKIAKDIAKGLCFIHEKGIIHRDIKSDNIMIFSTDPSEVCAKIGDLGSSRKCNKNMTINVGSTYWMSPEVYNSKKYSYPADIFSFGIVLWELITRKSPFEGETSFSSVTKKIANGLTPSFTSDEITKFKDICDIYNDCVKICPEDRPTAEQIHDRLKTAKPAQEDIPRLKLGSSSCNTSPRTKNNSLRNLLLNRTT